MPQPWPRPPDVCPNSQEMMASFSFLCSPCLWCTPLLSEISEMGEGPHLPWTVGIGWGLCHIILRRLRGVHVIAVAREAGDGEERRK